MNGFGKCSHQLIERQDAWTCRRGATDTCRFCSLSYCLSHVREVCPDSPETEWGQVSHASEQTWQEMGGMPRPDGPRMVRSVAQMPGKRTLILETIVLATPEGKPLDHQVQTRQYAGTITKRGKGWEMDSEMRRWLSRYIGNAAMALDRKWATEKKALEDIRGLMEWEWENRRQPPARNGEG